MRRLRLSPHVLGIYPEAVWLPSTALPLFGPRRTASVPACGFPVVHGYPQFNGVPVSEGYMVNATQTVTPMYATPTASPMYAMVVPTAGYSSVAYPCGVGSMYQQYYNYWPGYDYY